MVWCAGAPRNDSAGCCMRDGIVIPSGLGGGFCGVCLVWWLVGVTVCVAVVAVVVVVVRRRRVAGVVSRVVGMCNFAV